MSNAGNDLLALLVGGASSPAPPAAASTSTPSAIDQLFASQPPFSPAVQQPHSQSNNLLNLLSPAPAPPQPRPQQVSPGPVTSAGLDGLNLLDALFRNAASPSAASLTSTALKQQEPALTPNAAPTPPTVSSPPVPPVATKSMFDFESPFDLLAQASAKAKAPSAPSSRKPSAAVQQPPPAPPVPVAEPPRPVQQQRSHVQIVDSGDSTPSSPRLQPTPSKASTPRARATSTEEGTSSTPGTSLTIVKASKSARALMSDERKSLMLKREGGVEGETVDLEVTPIIRSVTAVQPNIGRQLALPGNTIAYITKVSKIRILDRATGARQLLKQHTEVIVDIEAAPPRGPLVTNETAVLATCGKDGKLIIWRVPRTFTEKTATHEVLVEITSASPTRFVKLRWSPNGKILAVLTAEGRIVLLDFASAAWKQKLAKVKSVNERDALQGQQTFAPASSPYVDFDFSADSGKLALLRGGEAPLEVAKVGGQDKPRVVTLSEKKGTPSQVVFCGDDAVAVSSDAGQTIIVTRVDSHGPTHAALRFPTSTSLSDFSRMAFDSPASSLLISHSTRGSIILVHLDLVKPAFKSIFEIVADDAIVAFEKQPEDPALFCVLANGITQIHLPTIEPVEEDEVVEEAKPIETEEPPVSTNVTDAVKVSIETATASDHEDATTRAALPVVAAPVQRSSPLAKGVNGTSHPPTPAPQPATSSQAPSSDLSSLLPDIRRLLSEFSAEQEQRLADERVANHKAELERQEQVLQTISTNLTKNTSKAIDATVRAEIKSTILPGLVKAVKESVNADIKAGVKDSVAKSIPDALEQLFKRADIANNLVQQLSTAARPLIAKTVNEAISQTFVPHLQQTSAVMLDRIANDLHSEMTGIRKTIVAEQSEAMTALSAEVATLRATVEQLAAAKEVSPPAREPTPNQVLADIVLSAVRGTPAELDGLIFNSSPQRFVRFFSHPTPLSLTALLVLIHKLCEVLLASPPIPLTPDNHTRLRWIAAASDAVDKHAEPAVADRVPGILAQTRQKLVDFRSRAGQIGDQQGVGAIEVTLRAVSVALERSL